MQTSWLVQSMWLTFWKLTWKRNIKDSNVQDVGKNTRGKEVETNVNVRSVPIVSYISTIWKITKLGNTVAEIHASKSASLKEGDELDWQRRRNIKKTKPVTNNEGINMQRTRQRINDFRSESVRMDSKSKGILRTVLANSVRIVGNGTATWMFIFATSTLNTTSRRSWICTR